MKKQIFNLMLGAAIFAATPAFCMEADEGEKNNLTKSINLNIYYKNFTGVGPRFDTVTFSLYTYPERNLQGTFSLSSQNRQEVSVGKAQTKITFSNSSEPLNFLVECKDATINKLMKNQGYKESNSWVYKAGLKRSEILDNDDFDLVICMEEDMNSVFMLYCYGDYYFQRSKIYIKDVTESETDKLNTK